MSFAHRFSPESTTVKEDGVRAVALDVHRDFCEVAIIAEGRVRSAGRIQTRPEALELFAASLDPRDWVTLEVTGNAWAIARILEPHVARCHTRVVDHRKGLGRQMRLEQLRGGDVDAHAEATPTGEPLPGGELPARLVEHPSPDGDDAAALLSQRNELIRRDRSPTGQGPSQQCLERDRDPDGYYVTISAL